MWKIVAVDGKKMMYLHCMSVPVTTSHTCSHVCVCDLRYRYIHIYICVCVYVCVCVRTSFHRPVKTSPEGKNRDPTPSLSPSLQLPEYVIFVSLEVNLPLPSDNRNKRHQKTVSTDLTVI